MAVTPNLVGKVMGILVIPLSILFNNILFSPAKWHIGIEESKFRTLAVIKEVHYHLHNLPTELLTKLLMLVSATKGGSLACRRIRRARHSGGVLADGLVRFGGLSDGT
jgi:hypothetical protein